MKKCYSPLSAGPAYYRMCSTDVYCSKQTGSSSTKGNHHPSFSSFRIGQKKTVDAAKICGAQKIRKATETQQNIRKWIGSPVLLLWGIYTPSARVLLTIIKKEAAHRYGQLYLHCSLIYFWVPSSCFCIVISLSLRGEIIPFSGVCQSGGCIIHAGEWWWLHALTDRLLWCTTRTTTSGNIIMQSIIFSFSIRLTPSCIFASSVQTSRWRICMSVIAAFASFSSLAFCRAGLL